MEESVIKAGYIVDPVRLVHAQNASPPSSGVRARCFITLNTIRIEERARPGALDKIRRTIRGHRARIAAGATIRARYRGRDIAPRIAHSEVGYRGLPTPSERSCSFGRIASAHIAV